MDVSHSEENATQTLHRHLSLGDAETPSRKTLRHVPMFIRSKSKYKDLMQPFSQAGLLGIHLVASTFVGALIGWYLDKWLDTKPTMFLLFLVFGIIAGFKNMYMETRKIQRELDKQDATARQAKPQD